MPSVSLTRALREEYSRLFDTLVYPSWKADEITESANLLFAGKERYQGVGMVRQVPWYFVGLVHIMESGGDFATHLHNGDPLTSRTTHVPKGRPKTGRPPFRWEDSAADALGGWRSWSGDSEHSLPRLLLWLEAWNGWGYRRYHPEVLSPYLWAGSTHYRDGKYGADGVFRAGLESNQIGAAVIFHRLLELRPAETPFWMSASTSPAWVFGNKGMEVRRLQEALNLLPGVFVRVDGFAGERTSDAFRRVTGSYLSGDPRGE